MSTPLYQWLASALPPEVAGMLERLRQMAEIQHLAVMPDVHIAGEFCVGMVLASHQWLFPNAVGGDIGCGMAAMAFDADACLLDEAHAAAKILTRLYELVPASRHHRALAPPMPPILQEMPLSAPLEYLKKSGGPAHLQLGTLGGGNHFLELQADGATGQLWLMLHSGSRHAGQIIHHHHIPAATRAAGILRLPADSAAGRAYIQDLTWARIYARENRQALLNAAAGALAEALQIPPRPQTLLDSDHNHLQEEIHQDQRYFVHRKGAQCAGPDQLGLIPGSMGTFSVHTRGRGCAAALNSSSHGAGRALSRHQARRSINAAALKAQLRGIWYDHRQSDSLREEAPGAYRDLDRVLAAQKDLTEVIRRLRPILSYKAP